MIVPYNQKMKNFHLSVVSLILIIFLGFELTSSYANDANGISIQNISIQPYSIKVGDTFTVTATLVNNSTVPIVVETGKCSTKDTQVPFFTVMFDNHAKSMAKNINCAGVGWFQILDPGKKNTSTSPDYTLNYTAIKSGTANATVTFQYHIINRTDLTQPNIEQTISKSFQFLINDVNETYAQKPPAYFTSPLQQIKVGVSAQNVKCGVNFSLVIKSEDGSPACVKPLTVKILSEKGWSKFESTQSNHSANAKTNPFGIVGLMYYYGGGPCGVGTCPLNTFNLKMNSNYTTYLLGYNICNDNSCIVRNDLSTLLPLNVIGMPNYKFIALPENPQWKHDDVFHIQDKVSSIPDNTTAVWTDLGNSTIIH